MRRFRLMLPLLAALCASSPAFAQSDAFKQAWQQSNALIDAGKYAQAESWAKQAVSLAQSESGPDSGDYASTIQATGIGRPEHEAVLEFGYRIQFTKFAYLQPDLQYVSHPSGTGRIPDAVVVGAQLGLSF